MISINAEHFHMHISLTFWNQMQIFVPPAYLTIETNIMLRFRLLDGNLFSPVFTTLFWRFQIEIIMIFVSRISLTAIFLLDTCHEIFYFKLYFFFDK